MLDAFAPALKLLRLKKLRNDNFDETFTKVSEHYIKTLYEINMRGHRLYFSDTDNFMPILTALRADILLLWLVELNILIGAA